MRKDRNENSNQPPRLEIKGDSPHLYLNGEPLKQLDEDHILGGVIEACKKLDIDPKNHLETIHRYYEEHPAPTGEKEEPRFCGDCKYFKTKECLITSRKGVIVDGQFLVKPTDHANSCEKYEENKKSEYLTEHRLNQVREKRKYGHKVIINR